MIPDALVHCRPHLGSVSCVNKDSLESSSHHLLMASTVVRRHRWDAATQQHLDPVTQAAMAEKGAVRAAEHCLARRQSHIRTFNIP